MRRFVWNLCKQHCVGVRRWFKAQNSRNNKSKQRLSRWKKKKCEKQKWSQTMKKQKKKRMWFVNNAHKSIVTLFWNFHFVWLFTMPFSLFAGVDFLFAIFFSFFCFLVSYFLWKMKFNLFEQSIAATLSD